MDVSIVIINFNTQELLRACLSSILAETSGLEFEIITIDNGSTDGSREMLENEFPGIKKIFNSQNKGFASANNQGIAISSGRFVLLLNSDIVVLDGAIQKTLGFMNDRPDVSIAGCKLLHADHTLQPSCLSFPSPWNLFSESFFLYKLFPRSRLFGGYYMSYFDYDKIVEVDVVMGAFMMIRRDVLEQAGLFDESFFMYTEETDFCYRAKQIGLKVFFYPAAHVVHFGGGSVESTEKYLTQVQTTQAYFIKKNFHGVQRHLALFLKRFGIALRVPVYLISGLALRDRKLMEKSRTYSLILRKTF